MQFRVGKRRSLGFIGLVGLVVYVGWMGGPYPRSVILRDAAVTSWINPTTSPIAGYVGPHFLYAGEHVGADGVIAVIADPLADRSALARAEADLDRAHRGELADLEFGTGKLEQMANTVIGAAMLGGALWIASRVIAVLTGETAPGTPFGLATAAMAGALNLYINFLSWDRVRQAVRAESSIVMKGQLQARRVKLISSFFVLITMTVAAASTDDRVVASADVLGSVFVAGFIVVNAFDMLSTGLVDLPDRSAGPKVHEAIDRALALHAADYGELARIRSRRSGRVIFIELALRFDPSLSIAQIDQRIDALKQSLGHEIEHADVSVLALAASR